MTELILLNQIDLMYKMGCYEQIIFEHKFVLSFQRKFLKF